MNFRRKSSSARAHMYHLIFIALAFTAEPAVGRQPDDFELKYLSIEQHRVVVLPPTHLAYQDDLDDAHAIADCIVPFQLRETHLIWSCLSKRSAHRLRQEGRGHGSDTSLRQEGGGPCDEVREAYDLRSEVHFDISEPGAIEGGS